MNTTKKRYPFFDEIESAYCWEGSATAFIEDETDNELILEIHGASMVEHSGDVEGIQTQVSDLKYEKFVENDITYTVLQATVSIKSEPRDHDGDYQVYVNGTVKIAKK